MAAVKMEEGEAAKIDILKNTLYDTVIQHGSNTRLFTQNDLLDLDVIPHRNLQLLLQVIQALTNDKLLVGVTGGQGGLAWKYRSREDAKKYTSLPDETTMLVYQAIDEAGNDGIWKRTIENRVNISDAVMKVCIKILEQRGYIASMRSVEQPNRKMYIRADLRPSHRATGGPWFTDGQLDGSFIETLEGVVFEFIKGRGAYHQAPGAGFAGATRMPKRGVVTAAPTVTAGTKRSAKEMASDDVTPVATPAKPVAADSPAPAATTTKSARKPEMFLPMPAGYKGYPTIHDITEFIHQLGITSNTTLGENDIRQLVEVLIFDGLIEPIKVGKRRGFRALRPTKQSTIPYNIRAKEMQNGIGLHLPHTGVLPPTNGLTEAPCGRCPVFDLCEEGGTVSPSTCVYFLEWLGLEEKKKEGDGVAEVKIEAGSEGKGSAPP